MNSEEQSNFLIYNPGAVSRFLASLLDWRNVKCLIMGWQHHDGEGYGPSEGAMCTLMQRISDEEASVQYFKLDMSGSRMSTRFARSLAFFLQSTKMFLESCVIVLRDNRSMTFEALEHIGRAIVSIHQSRKVLQTFQWDVRGTTGVHNLSNLVRNILQIPNGCIKTDMCAYAWDHAKQQLHISLLSHKNGQRRVMHEVLCALRNCVSRLVMDFAAVSASRIQIQEGRLL
jgi:hypothetical protein